MLSRTVICHCHSATGGLVSKHVVPTCDMPELISYWGFDVIAWTHVFHSDVSDL